MASVNKWIGIGNLGKDPEQKYMPSGECVCNISIACTESWRDKNSGEKKEMTEWVRISFFGKLAEIAGQYLRKGSQVYIEGSLRTRKWTDKDGAERYTTEIRADTMKMLGSKSDGSDIPRNIPPANSSGHSANNPPPPKPASGGGFDDFDSDIPF